MKERKKTEPETHKQSEGHSDRQTATRERGRGNILKNQFEIALAKQYTVILFQTRKIAQRLAAKHPRELCLAIIKISLINQSLFLQWTQGISLQETDQRGSERKMERELSRRKKKKKEKKKTTHVDPMIIAL